jgi:hypothetical protein
MSSSSDSPPKTRCLPSKRKIAVANARQVFIAGNNTRKGEKSKQQFVKVNPSADGIPARFVLCSPTLRHLRDSPSYLFSPEQPSECSRNPLSVLGAGVTLSLDGEGERWAALEETARGDYQVSRLSRDRKANSLLPSLPVTR